MLNWQKPSDAGIPKDREILVTAHVSESGRDVFIVQYNMIRRGWLLRSGSFSFFAEEILAWAEMPKPYMGETK